MIAASLGLTARQVHELLTTAVRAPSVHNSQPWRFAVHPDRIEVYADAGRRLPHTDPTDKGLRLSCGAVVMNLRLLLQSNGIRPLVSLLPGGSPDLTAVIRHGGRLTPLDATMQLASAIPRRITNRKPFLDAAVPTATRFALERAAQTESSWAQVVSDPAQRAAIRRLILAAHREQQTVEGFQREFRHWTSGSHGRADGVPAASAGPLPEPQDEWVLRDFSDRHNMPRITGKDFEPEPLLLVLCSFFDGPLAELVTGQALQNMLLTATNLGLAASLLSQPLEVTHTRKELRTVTGAGMFPQTILRLGYGTPTPPTPRRSIEHMLADSHTDAEVENTLA